MENPQIIQKKPKLTKKRRGFVKDYIANGENGADAAKKNYNITTENSARAVASELLTFPNVREAIEIERSTLKSALEKQGVTPEKIARKVDELLDNKDPNAIDKGLKYATNIYGVDTEPEKKQGGNTYNFIFSPEVQGQVKEIEAKIKEQLIKKHVQEN